MTTQNITSHGNTYLYNETISDMADNSMDHVLSSVRIMKKQQPTNTVGSKIEKYNASKSTMQEISFNSIMKWNTTEILHYSKAQ